MNANIKNILLASLALFLSGCANQNFKAEEPVDYKDNARYGFGSLIKDKDSALRKYFNSSSSNDSENKLEVQKVSSTNPKDKIWNAAIVALKDFPIGFMDKKNGIIETETIKVSQFDNTGTCSYKINVKVINEKDFKVTITSEEDSSARLKKHEEIIKSKITKEL